MEIMEKRMKIVNKIVLKELLKKMVFHSKKIVHFTGVGEGETFGLNGTLV